MSVNYREPQWLLPNEKNLQYPAAGATQGSGLTTDRHSLYSMDFDGSSHVTASYSGDVYACSIWFKPNATITTSTLVQYLISFGAQFDGILLGSSTSSLTDELITINNDNSGIGRSAYTATGGTISNSWHHICFNWTGSVYQIWLDGVNVQNTSNGTPALINSSDIRIGKNSSGTARYFDGEIDEVAIFSRALSSSEITTLYNSGSPSNPMLLSGKPVAYYPLGEQARNPNGSSDWRFPNEVLQGQAIEFDGTNKIDIGTSLANTFGDSYTGDITVSMWFYADTVTSDDGLFTIKTGSSFGNITFLIAGSTARMYYNNDGTYISGSVSINQWYNLVGVLKAGDASGTKLYLNGSAVATATTTPSSSLNFSGMEAWIGNYWAGNNGFDGKMSNVAIWDSGLSSDDIINVYNYGAPQTSYTVTPTAWYKLDKTSEYAGLNANWHNALDFNGSSNYLTIPSTNFAGSSGEVSYSFWLNPDTYTHPSSNDYGYIFSGVEFASGGIAMSEGATFAAANGTLSAGMVYYFDGGSVYIATSALTENVWSHVALVFNSGGEIKSYVNGQLDTTLSSITTPYKSTFENIGKFYNSTYHLNGQYSNFAVFNQAISAEDVKYLYNGGTPQTNISFEPTSWWKLDNLTTGIQDSGSASVNATATDSPTVVTDSVAVDQWNFDNAVQSQTPNWSSALDFDGSSNVNLGGHTTPATGLSLSCWMKTSESVVYNESRSPFGARPNGTGNYTLGRIRSQYATPTELNVALFNSFGTTVLNDGKWHHLVYTFDSTTFETKAYVDGNTTPEVTFTFPSYAFTSFILGIGWNGFNAPFKFNGQVSNCVRHDKVITSSEVATLYNNGSPELSPSFSPTGWWKCDNITTGIQDSVGSDNGTNNGATETQTNVWTPRLNGESSTLPSSALTSSDLQFNSAYSSFSLNFDSSSNTYINCGGQSLFNGLTAFSISCWIKTNGTQQDYAAIFSYQSSTTQYVKLAFYPSEKDRIRVVVRPGSSNPNYVKSSAGSIVDDEWVHIVAVGDANNLSNLNVYINGVLDNDVTQGNITTLAQSSDIYIGTDAGAVTTRDFNGKIDETAVWNRALNQSEITSIYNNGYPKDITALAPISWWRLGEDAYFVSPDFIIPNKISGAPNGTSQNMPATALVANAPGSYAAGLGSSLVEADRVGDAALSTANSLSFNMTPLNRVSYPAGYVPTQVDNVYSMAFDGLSDYVNGGVNTSLVSATNFSISGWFYFDSVANNKTLFSYGGTGVNYGMTVQTHSSGNLIFVIASATNDSGTNYIKTNLSSVLTTSTWYNIVCTYDGSKTGNTDKAKIYINGTEVTYAAGLGTIPATTSASTGPFNIGQWDLGGSNRFFYGNIDEVAIFDYTLSARQIKQDIYNGTTSGKTADLNNISNLTAPVAWYRMGD